MNWADKHRPSLFRDIKGNEDSLSFLSDLAEHDNLNIPAVLMSGPSGVGKTTAAKAFTKSRFQDMQNHESMFLTINASLDRGVETIRSLVLRFASGFSTNATRGVVFLDEIDSMTKQAQVMLAEGIINVFRSDLIFLLACNDSREIDCRLQSKCYLLKFEALNEMELTQICKKVCKSENIHISKRKSGPEISNSLYEDQADSIKTIFSYAIIQSVIICSNHDARQLIQLLELSHTKQVVTIEEVYQLANKPQLKIIEKSITLAKTNLNACMIYVKNELINKQALTIEDILTEMENWLNFDNFEVLDACETAVLYEAIFIANFRVNGFIREGASWLQLANVFAKLAAQSHKSGQKSSQRSISFENMKNIDLT